MVVTEQQPNRSTLATLRGRTMPICQIRAGAGAIAGVTAGPNTQLDIAIQRAPFRTNCGLVIVGRCA
eukprot:11169928-Lingulodinium_polyedra.AAC.1